MHNVEHKVYYMNINVDKRTTDITYVDKNNLHVATDKDIIKLINIDISDDVNNNPIRIASSIIAMSKGLNKEETNLYYTLLVCKYARNTKAIANHYMKEYNKSYSTYCRAIEGLVKAGIIKIVSNVIIEVKDDYDLDIQTLNAKFLVIELNAKVTSNGLK